MTFRSIDKSEVSPLLDEIDGYCENKRYNRSQFEKYLRSEKTIDADDRSMFLGMFDDGGKCLSLCYLNKDVPEGFILLAEVQCVVRGFGKPLIEKVISLSKNLWWAADPTGGESLVNYYRQFDLKETSLDWSKWVDGPETFFYKASSEEDEARLLEFLRSSVTSRNS
jgi:hypothetical protein